MNCNACKEQRTFQKSLSKELTVGSSSHLTNCWELQPWRKLVETNTKVWQFPCFWIFQTTARPYYQICFSSPRSLSMLSTGSCKSHTLFFKAEQQWLAGVGGIISNGFVQSCRPFINFMCNNYAWPVCESTEISDAGSFCCSLWISGTLQGKSTHHSVCHWKCGAGVVRSCISRFP